MPDFDVVICGGGVGGLTLAALLGRHGRSVLLVEKQREYRMVHKGELMQPSSLHVLDAAGLHAPFVASGALPVSALSCRRPGGSELVSLDYDLLDGPYRSGLVHSYREMLNAFAAALAPGVTRWTGCRAEHVVRDADGRINGVRVAGDVPDRRSVVDVRATVTVACDGRGSRLRDAAGIAAESTRYDHQLVGFELDDSPQLGNQMNAYLTDRGLRALFALPEGRARLYVQVPTGAMRELSRPQLPRWIDDVLAHVPALELVEESLRRSLTTMQVLPAWRLNAERWTQPGFALLGDAAHGVHPMVGQGMNSAIADAGELAQALADDWPLDAVSADAALRRYCAARRPKQRHVSRLSHNMAALLTGTGRISRLLRANVLAHNQDNIRVRRRLTQKMSGHSSRSLGPVDWLSICGLPVTDGRSPATSEPHPLLERSSA
ncbi:MAG: FAD-dependent oxidoreductase [Jatrophihabitans sp.]